MRAKENPKILINLFVFENLCLTLLLVVCTHTYEWLAAPTDEGYASDHSEKTKKRKTMKNENSNSNLN